ncbi:pre-rRNA processing protein, variant 2 [Balamuthia mandrillaris]
MAHTFETLLKAQITEPPVLKPVRQCSLLVLHKFISFFSSLSLPLLVVQTLFFLYVQLMVCLEKLLAAQEKAAWKQGPTIMEPFKLMLGLCLDERPKVRQAAQQAITALFASSSSSSSGTKGHLGKQAYNATHHFCLSFLQQASNDASAAAMKKSGQLMLYGLGLLKSLLPYLPSSSVQPLSVALLELFSMGPIPRSHAMQCLAHLFQGSNDDNLSAAHVAQLLNGIAETQPNAHDVEPTLLHINLLKNGLLKLQRLDEVLCANFLPCSVKYLVNNLLSDNVEVLKKTSIALKELLRSCVTESMIERGTTAALEERSGGASAVSSSSLRSIIESLVVGMEATIQNSQWKYLLPVLPSLFGKMKPENSILAFPLLRGAATIYYTAETSESDDAGQQQLNSELQSSLGAAVAAIGPAAFLQILPLNLDQSSAEEQPNAWLLPILKEYTKHAQLSFFISDILPLTNSMKERAVAAHQKGMSRNAKEAEVIYMQLWDLFPSFCILPTDIPESFKKIAKTLGEGLTNEAQLRSVICTGLQTLINNFRALEEHIPYASSSALSCKTSSTNDKENSFLSQTKLSSDDAQAALQAIAGFSRNFLPTLFNLFGSEITPELRTSVGDTIHAFLVITPKPMVNTFFKNVIQKLLESGKQQKESEATSAAALKRRILLTEMAIKFVPHLNEDSLNLLWRITKTQLEEKDAKLHKKCYKVTESMCKNHPSWVLSHVEELKTVLSRDIATCESAAKKLRLRCMQHIIRHLPDYLTPIAVSDEGQQRKQAETFIASLLGEVLMCIKEANAKTRNAAFDLLVEMAGKMCVAYEPEDPFAVTLTAAVKNHDIEMAQKLAADPSSSEAMNAEGESDLSHSKHLAEMIRNGLQPKLVPMPRLNATPFLKMVVAGLAGSTTHMMSASLTALSRLIFNFKDELEAAFVSDLVGSVVLLLSLRSREIIKAALGFLKVSVSAVPSSLLEPHLTSLIPGMMTWSGDAKNRFRSKVKILLERLIRRFGVEKVSSLVPEQHRKLFTSVRKDMDQKKKTKKKNEEEEEEEEDDDDEEQDEENEGGKKGKDKKDKGKEKAKRPTNTPSWILENENDAPLDFLDPRHLQHVVSTNPNKKRYDSSDDEIVFEYDAEGKMIVMEPEEDGFKGKKKKKESAAGSSSDANDGEQPTKVGGKRGRAAMERPDGSEGVRHKTPTKRAKAANPEGTHTGRNYKSSKAGGDVKKEGKFEPYAYLPLDPKNLNKRRKHKAVAQFSNLVSAAKTGSKTGRLQHNRAQRKNQKKKVVM